MTTDELKRNIESVTERVRRAADKAGHNVTLVAATKTVSPVLINAAIGRGILDIGENRVNEFVEKFDVVKGANRHFIGTLQSNKAKYIVGNAVLIQSVSTKKLARVVDKLAAKRDIFQDVLIEVNIGCEPNKSGADIADTDELIEYVRSLDNIHLRGLMAVPPIGADDSIYQDMYRIFARHKSGLFDTLSMGMSGDFERAIDNGSNMVRIGTAIFGARGV